MGRYTYMVIYTMEGGVHELRTYHSIDNIDTLILLTLLSHNAYGICKALIFPGISVFGRYALKQVNLPKRNFDIAHSL
jgi:hypothetical protein